MATKKIIEIDEEKCIGCGLCANACPQSAIEMVDGKAKFTGELVCDGLGACIGECPVDAIEFVTCEVADPQPAMAGACPISSLFPTAGGCPGSVERSFEAEESEEVDGDGAQGPPSALTHWPIQLHLVNPTAPAYRDADVLVAADCTAFSLGSFHPEMLKGKSLLIACPKLDDTAGYVEKLTALFAEAAPRSVTVARMEVPCCFGLTNMVREARERAGSDLEVREVVIGVRGDVKSDSQSAIRRHDPD